MRARVLDIHLDRTSCTFYNQAVNQNIKYSKKKNNKMYLYEEFRIHICRILNMNNIEKPSYIYFNLTVLQVIIAYFKTYSMLLSNRS